MKVANLVQLVAVNLGRDRKGALLSALGVAAGIAALAFFVALGAGVGDVVRTRIFPADARAIEVVPPRVNLALFGAVELNEEAVARLRALPGVEAAYRKMQVRVPAVSRYDGAFFGQRLRMGLEILGEGVDPELLAADLRGAAFADPGGQGPIPVVVSGRLLEIYNKSFAKQRGLPALSPAMLGGFQFPVSWGRSYVTAAASTREGLVQQDAVLVGISDRAMLQGITIPLDAARRLNRAFGADADRYSSVTVLAKTPDAVPAISAAVKELGFEIDDSERTLAERVGMAVAIVTGALALLSLLICGLAVVNISLTLGAAIRGRSREIGILRAVGATSRDVTALVLGEAAAIGAAGGLTGAVIARLVALGVDRAAGALLPDFPFKPESFFAFQPLPLGCAALLGVAAALIGAWPPARRAASLDPARTMGG